MYYAIVFLLMLALPAVSIAIEAFMSGAMPLVVLLAKWFVFWAVGMRLFLAGVRQIAQPKYTAQVILGLKSDEVLLVVRELGFANLSMGLLGLATLAVPGWQLAAALAGGIFYGLAGINHALQPHRNRLENVAMVSDLLASAVLLGLCILALV
ncbi:hypothetical protein RS694_12385 [Rhodoferax saidenbachensis]|uniref:Uncharacterized protein n=1 Tax=Rhodoferax saidenbachensis TaxID=1484693 RepID=A0A1P8KFN0_9BURK|nr:hypothetical protein RS694_12385 [Rhodoferax saidenbachensis]